MTDNPGEEPPIKAQACGWRGEVILLAEALEYLPYVLSVFTQGVTIDQNIIEVSGAENIQVVPKGVVDVMLERSKSVGKPKRHH